MIFLLFLVDYMIFFVILDSRSLSRFYNIVQRKFEKSNSDEAKFYL